MGLKYCFVYTLSRGKRGAVTKVQRQGTGQDARLGHLRLRRTPVCPHTRQVGQDGPAVREIL